MNIVFLAPFGIRPKGTVIARMVPLAAELQAHGRRVTIIAPPYTNPEDSGRTEVVRGVTLRNIRLAPGGAALSAPVLARRMLRAARDEEPDLIHLFKPKGYGGLAAMLHLILPEGRERRTPLFLDTDDWEGRGGMNALHNYSKAQRLLFAFQEEWLPPRVRGVTAASRELEARVAAMGVAPERLLYLPNCVDDLPQGDGARIRQRLGIAAHEPVVLLYTRFFEFSQEQLHNVFAELARRVAGVRFLVVGRGRNGEEELLAAAAREKGFADRLFSPGWVEPADLPDWLAAGDVALYPFADTLVNRAKCPAKLTELMRAGLPVVADRVGQIGEYVEDGVTGILCNPDVPGEMVEHAADLLADPAGRRALGEAGRERILSRFNWRDAAARLDAFYDNLTRRRNLP